jgi:hypothetical protein
MAQSGWRLPDELLRRVRVRCAEEGVRQNVWVERALEKALGESVGHHSPAPSRTSATPKAKPAPPVFVVEEPARAGVPVRATVSAFYAQSEAMKRQARMNKAKGL